MHGRDGQHVSIRPSNGLVFLLVGANAAVVAAAHGKEVRAVLSRHTESVVGKRPSTRNVTASVVVFCLRPCEVRPVNNSNGGVSCLRARKACPYIGI